MIKISAPTSFFIGMIIGGLLWHLISPTEIWGYVMFSVVVIVICALATAMEEENGCSKKQSVPKDQASIDKH